MASTNYDLVKMKVSQLEDDVKEIKEVLRGSYVTQDQFAPVKSIIYGLVGSILVTVIGALAAIVLKGH